MAASQKVWSCENGRRTVLHAVAYDVCQAPLGLDQNVLLYLETLKGKEEEKEEERESQRESL